MAGLDKNLSKTNGSIFQNTSNVGDWLNGLGGLLTGILGYKQYNLGKDELNFQRDAFNFNKDISLASSLAKAQGRLAEQQSYGDNRDLGYLQNLIATLQSYGSNNSNVATAPPQQNPAVPNMNTLALSPADFQFNGQKPGTVTQPVQQPPNTLPEGTVVQPTRPQVRNPNDLNWNV